MSFNKRYITSESSIKALESNSLNVYYGKSDALFFEDNLSHEIYKMFLEGIPQQEILYSIIKKNMEEKTNEVYQSN